MTADRPADAAVEAACLAEHGEYWGSCTEHAKQVYRQRARRALAAFCLADKPSDAAVRAAIKAYWHPQPGTPTEMQMDDMRRALVAAAEWRAAELSAKVCA